MAENVTKKKEYIKKARLNSKPGKYAIERHKGKSAKEAEIIAYGKYNNNSTQIENTKTYQAVEKSFGDHLKKILPLEQLAQLTKRNAKQFDNLGASNQAIQIALEKLEPKQSSESNEDRVIIVMRPPDDIKVKLKGKEIITP